MQFCLQFIQFCFVFLFFCFTPHWLDVLGKQEQGRASPCPHGPHILEILREVTVVS